MELTGEVIEVLTVERGMGKKGQWQKQSFILETKGQYPKKVCLSLWGDKVNSVEEGQDITAQIELESREYNGRWYTEVKAWKIIN